MGAKLTDAELAKRLRQQRQEGQARHRQRRLDNGERHISLWIQERNSNWLDYWVKGGQGRTLEKAVNLALSLAARNPDLLNQLDSETKVEEEGVPYQPFLKVAENGATYGS